MNKVSQLLSPRDAWVRACTKSYIEARSKGGNYKNLIRVTYPQPDSVRIQSKVRDISLNSKGTKLIVASRDATLVISIASTNQYDQSSVGNITLSNKCTIPIKTFKILTHPKDPDVFILLCQEHNKETPLVRAYESKSKTKVVDEWVVEGADLWYTGAWSPDGSLLILIDRQNQVFTMEYEINYINKSAPAFFKSFDTEIYGITFLNRADYVLFYGSEGIIEFFHISAFRKTIRSSEKAPSQDPSMSVKAHSQIVTCCEANASNNFIATGGYDHTVHVFEAAYNNREKDPLDIVCVGTFPDLEGQISNISFSKCGLLVAWGTRDSANYDENDYKGEVELGNFNLIVAGVKPCEIYHKQPTYAPVTHCLFLKNSYVVIFVMDYDYMKTGPASNFHCPIGLLYLE